MGILRDLSPLVEQVSVDETFGSYGRLPARAGPRAIGAAGA